MNDDRFEHELSQFLDSRLPSGRREQLLEHIDTEEDATRLLEEMEQAQDLARSLTVNAIGPTFSETLWQRIRSGEGSPEAVFREPLSIWTKARYVATGAVAAAAVLVAFIVLTRTDRTSGHTPPTDRTEVAGATTGNRLRPRATTPDRFDAPLFSVAQVAPETVAHAGQLECVAALSALQTRAPEVERRLEQVDPRDIIVELEPVAVRARGGAHVIRWMQREKMVELPGEFDAALALAERILHRMHLAGSANDRAQLRVAVQDLKELEIDGLRREFYTVCCRPPQEFRSLLREQIVRHPDVRHALRIQMVDSSSAAAPVIQLHHIAEPLGNGVLIFERGSSFGFGTLRIQGGGMQRLEVRVELEHEEQFRLPRGR